MTPSQWPTTDLLSRRASTTPDRTALIDGDADRTWTYRELDREVSAVTAALDVDPGDRIGTLLPTGPDLVTVAFAAARAGGTLVLLPPTESVDALAAKAEQARLNVLLCDDASAPLATDLVQARERESGRTIDSVRSIDGTTSGRVNPLPRQQRGPSPDPVELDPDHTQLVVFTSGTTGEPKGVRLTVENLRASAIASAYRLGIDPADRWLVPLPQYHTGGFAPIVRTALYGTTLVTNRSFEPETVARLVEERGCTGISVVPTMVRSLLEWGWQPPDRLRFVLVGGAPSPPDLVERALGAGIPVHPTYGASETASQVATATPEQARQWPDAVGQPLFGTDVRIVDRDGNTLDPGETGELVVSGPTVSPGYLDPDQTARSFENGAFRTGDLGYRDEDGRLRVTGRRSDRIVTGGETVDPTEVARSLEAHDGVADAAVVGLPNERWGERVAAAVVPIPGRTGLDPDEIETVAAERLAPHKQPRTIEIVAELPRTRSGTVDRAAVREGLLESSATRTDG